MINQKPKIATDITDTTAGNPRSIMIFELVSCCIRRLVDWKAMTREFALPMALPNAEIQKSEDYYYTCTSSKYATL